MSQRQKLINWGLWFSASTGLILTLIATRFIEYMPEISSLKAIIFISTGIFSHFSILSFIFFLFILIPTSLLIPSASKIIRQFSILSATFGAVLLIADTLVYAQYRFHITGFIFDMLFQGGNDIIAMSWVTWLTVVLSLIGIYLLFFFVDRLIWNNLNQRVLKTYKLRYILVLFVTLLSSNVIHLWADTQYDQRVTSLVRHIPMFTPATAKEALLSSGLLDAESIRKNRHIFKMPNNTNVNYPKNEIKSYKPDSQLNVLLIALDAARFDTLDKNIMPTFYKLSQSRYAQKYQQHYSGGNSTRTGIFNLFYGLPGTYWDAFSATETSPVLMDAFQKYNYELGIFASAPLNQPAFDRTVFSNVEGLKLRADGKTPWEKDINITDNWLNFIDKRDITKPFFGFLFYDGIHGYSLPNDADLPFLPNWDRIDHLKLGPNFDATPYINRYKNSAYQVDKQVQRVLKQLEDNNLLDSTIVIITSDHGEEFNDNNLNFWGHGSNFTPTQVHVPLVIHWPNRNANSYDHKTSHSDLSVTLMQDLFRTENPKEEYSIGQHLNDKNRPEWTISGSYVNYAILEKDRHIVTFQTGHYEVLDNTGRPAKNKELNSKTTKGVMEALSRFYTD